MSAQAANTDRSSDAPFAAGIWKSIFTEEFDEAELSPAKWTTCYWWNDRGCSNLGNKELQWYQPGNVRISNGNLRLRAQPETVTGYKGQVFKYTSGMVTTGVDYSELPRKSRFEFHFGHVEMRAKIPAGKGLWPALWMLPTSRESRPEIDIMEVLGHTPTLLRMHLHTQTASGERKSVGEDVKTVDLAKGWHVYGLTWEADAIIWYLDGKEVWRKDNPDGIPNEPMYLLINLAVGGNWPGQPDRNTKFPADFLIDYVRVWQRENQ
ncbi:MAG: glycoside hydrolase family 16 protein [Rhizobiaceae bacterium]